MTPNWKRRVRSATLVMIDIEATGPEIGLHSMTEIGVAAGSVVGGITHHFRGVMTPLSTRVGTHALCAKAYETGLAEGEPPIQVMRALQTFWMALPGTPLPLAMPAAFDWPWLVWYAHRFLGTNPFGFKCHCMSSEFAVRGLRFDGATLTHDADDASIQLEAYLGSWR